MIDSNGSHAALPKEVALQAKRAETGEYLTSCAIADLDGYLTDALTQALLAEVKLDGESEAQPHLARTSQILQKGRAMTQEILGSQPPAPAQIERLDLNQIVRKTGRNFLTWSPENIDLQLKLSPSLALVPGDRLQLERLVICLLVNMALMSDSGRHRLTLSTRQLPQEAVHMEEPSALSTSGQPGEVDPFESNVGEPLQTPPWSPSPARSIAFRFSLTRHAVQHQQGLLSVRHLPDGEVRITVHFPEADVSDSSPASDSSITRASGVMLEMIRVPADR